MAKSKNNNYTVYFVEKNWVEVTIEALDEHEARIRAKSIIEKSPYKDKRIGICDGTIKFAGITLLDVINQID